jgi:N-hydroxyarylamine O-acetyltransferase
MTANADPDHGEPDPRARSPWDLDRYLRRIGHKGSVRPDFQTLASLVRLHARTIPFENLNPLLGEPVPLDPASLQRKLIEQGRGGYCYEQNLLLAGMLRTAGFEVSMHAARILWQVPAGEVRPRTHMLLRAALPEGAYLADVGLGGMTLDSPLRLDVEVAQPTGLEPFRILRPDARHYELQARLGSVWTPLYSFDLQEQHLADYELWSWYLCNHPDSHFRSSLFAARTHDGARTALLNNRLTTHDLRGGKTQRLLATDSEMVETLQRVLGIRVGDSARLRARLREILARARTEPAQDGVTDGARNPGDASTAHV